MSAVAEKVLFDSAASVLAAVGRQLGETEWMQISQERINQFADATGDHQWIHVDPEQAKNGPFGACVAHGYLTLSLANLFLPQLVAYSGLKMGVNYGCEKVRFPAPVLVNSLVRYPGNEFYFISPEELKIPDYLVEDTLKPTNVPYHEVSSLEDTLPELDMLYMTRVQKERFFNEEDYIRLKDIYILDQEKLNLAKADMPVLHPLPRVDEIAPGVDADPRAAYFQQVLNGKFIRMALILSLLDLTDPVTGKKVLVC